MERLQAGSCEALISYPSSIRASPVCSHLLPTRFLSLFASLCPSHGAIGASSTSSVIGCATCWPRAATTLPKEAQEPPALASAAPLGLAVPTEWSDTPCEASPWHVSNSVLPPNGSSLARLPAHVR